MSNIYIFSGKINRSNESDQDSKLKQFSLSDF